MSALVIEGLEVQVKTHFWSARRRLLGGVSFRVEEGEIFGFLGPNGAGKTTTIKSVLGLMRPSAGRINLLGDSIDSPAIRARVGFMPERAYFSEHLTGREVVMEHALLAGLPLAAVRRRTAEVLDQVGLTAAAGQRLGTYSKGMLQRVGIAQAIVGDPELVILDEPQSGLDPLGRRDVRQVMLDLRAAGKTVFFSTHILPDVEMICDRVAILIDGRVRRVGALDAMVNADEALVGVEIVAEGCTPELVARAREIGGEVQALGTSHRFTAASREAANRLLDALRAGGATVHSLQSHRGSLEEVFVREATAIRAREAETNGEESS